MYVCLCKGITDSQIKNAVDDGATSLRALRKELGAMTQCGKCASLTKEILNDQLKLNRSVNFDLFYSAI
ncbi:MAG: bacterioferritin-associated ferredoxin [Saccharospirillaceae bacterium]|nr:bacterioferritin-associated ferredoxin [Pseudomonadales bacterium]NRB78583.1 bacterioferritin-associated ferredoxin [Saccharospirillaceae bacterium]